MNVCACCGVGVVSKSFETLFPFAEYWIFILIRFDFSKQKKMKCFSLTSQKTNKEKTILTFPCWLLSNLKAWVAEPLFGFKMSEEAGLTCFCIYSTKKERVISTVLQKLLPPKRVKRTASRLLTDETTILMEFFSSGH